MRFTCAGLSRVSEAITPRHRVMVYADTYTGLRAGEVEALRRKDVDLLHNRLSVVLSLKEVNTTSENIADEDKGLIFGAPKNGESRVVVIPGFLNKMLTEHLEAEQPTTAQGYPAVNDDGELRWTRDPADPERLLFVSTEGEPIRHDNFYKRHFKPAVKRRYCTEWEEDVKAGAEDCPSADPTISSTSCRPRNTACASTTCGTPARRCSSRRALTRRRSKTTSATRTFRPPSTSTATYCRPSTTHWVLRWMPPTRAAPHRTTRSHASATRSRQPASDIYSLNGGTPGD